MQDQVSAQLADHGDFRAHYEAQLGQVLSHLIAAIDLFDDVYIRYDRFGKIGSSTITCNFGL